MTAEKDKAKEQTKDEKKAAPPVEASGKKPLSAEDLDKVSGGINPQPLPPGRSRLDQ